MNKTIATAAAAVLGFLGVIILLGSWYTIDQGERGVVLRNGEIIETVDAGLHFKVPIIDSVQKMSVRTELRTYKDVAAYSKDQQTAMMVLSVNYRLDPSMVDEVYARYGSEGIAPRAIDPKVWEKVKTVFGQFNAVEAIQGRAKLNLDIQEAVQTATQGTGAVVESVQIQNIDFSDEYERSIEARMQAEVEVQKLKQNLEQDRVKAEQVRVTAAGQADATRAKARADADATEMRGAAEAKAIKAKGDALRENPALIALISAERWDGRLPATMVPGGAVPFVNVGK